ncbi:hypothetical protein D9756_003351 [Leucocoprinus leucothites]|uniref:Uncharacterized protein n=1 Tax=Leucocoprinus leucothites TaxID=201217 RepID=A0A8H5G6V4_9AGAR|nr:hypothetical protein D9756_003351 [Leucoagaricus leucothites]
MGLLRRQNHALTHRQIPGAAPTASGIGGAAITVDPNAGTTVSDLQLDTQAPQGGGFSTAPALASGFTPTITIPPTNTPELSPTSQSPDASSSVKASSSSVAPISMSTVIGSCVGAFIGTVGLICLGFWFYRRYHRSLKAQYGAKGRGPINTRADMQRRLSHREPWGKLEDRNPEDKWEGHPKTEESVGPMEKLTMFKKAPSVRTAYTHTEEEPVQFEMSHPFAQQYSLYNNGQGNVSMPDPKPFTASNTWDDAGQGSFLSVRTQSDRLSGSMSPSLNMAIPTPPATALPHHHWESAEIVNMEGQSAEIVNPFADENRPARHEKRKSSGNPFFGAHEDMPRRRSRSNSLVSKTSRASRVRSVSESIMSSIHVPIPKLDKGKGRAIDPFDDENSPAPTPSSARYPTITTSVPPVAVSHATPTSPLVPPRPAFAVHNASLSTSSSSSNEHALASLIAALDGDTTEEDVQARLRIASMQPSIHSTTSMYSDTTETGDMTNEFPLPPSTPGHSTPTLESYVTAESDRTVKTR